MFEVGKKVICVKSHSNGKVKKGQVFELHGIRKSVCNCKGECMLDIGMRGDYGTISCNACGVRVYERHSIFWFSSTLFAPYDDSLSETTVEELLYQLTA